MILALGAAPPPPAALQADDTPAILEAAIREVVVERVVRRVWGGLPVGRELLLQTDLSPVSPGYQMRIPSAAGGVVRTEAQAWSSSFPLHFVSKAKLNEVFMRSESWDWKEFYNEFPKALCIVTFSEVRREGVQSSRAVVEVTVTWGSLAGESYLVDLRREAGSWKVHAVEDGPMA